MSTLFANSLKTAYPLVQSTSAHPNLGKLGELVLKNEPEILTLDAKIPTPGVQN